MIYQKIYDLIQSSYSSKNYYNIIETILRILDIDLNLSPIEDIKNNVDIFRKKMGNELLSKQLYKNLPYCLKIEKNSINLILINNKYIDENTSKYISYYLNLNIIIIKNNKYRYINKYNNTIDSIILIENNKNKYKPVFIINDNNIYNIFNDNDINNILKYFTIDNRIIFNNNNDLSDKDFKQIEKIKLLPLYKIQNICNNYNINIYKYIDSKKLFKKKLELFEELKINLINKNI
jgi:hypothetical protein